MKLSDFDYHLPPEMIAQRPADRRDESRLMVLDRDTGAIEHRKFPDLADFLRPEDVLVINDTRVNPWRVTGRRATGGHIDGLLLGVDPSGTWRGIFKSHGRLADGETLSLLDARLSAHLVAKDDAGIWTIRFDEPDAAAVLEAHGLAPVPPYIRRTEHDAPRDTADRERYQTVYAERPGAVAAPTAGLHFTPKLLGEIEAKGTAIARLTLHVGQGTFQSVKTEDLSAHRMHSEEYELTADAAALIESRRRSGGRIVAVGTTSVRTIETCAREDGSLAPGRGATSIFILPPYRFRAVDALVTNFHLPKSTLLMLVSAFAGRERILAAYEEAKRQGYRFFSFGDAMLIV